MEKEKKKTDQKTMKTGRKKKDETEAREYELKRAGKMDLGIKIEKIK